LASHRFNSYLAGSVMVLIGALLIAYLAELLLSSYLAPLFLVGVGVIFALMAIFKAKSRESYEMPAKTTLTYGVLAIVIGVLWLLVYVAAALVGYLLGLSLIFFGMVFLAYFRFRRKST